MPKRAAVNVGCRWSHAVHSNLPSYVGPPLVVAIGNHSRTIGFDIRAGKVAACQAGTDLSRELSDAQMAEAVYAEYTSNGALLAEAGIIIVAAPTPLSKAVG